MGFLRTAPVGDVHLEENHYFCDTAQCLDWFVADGIRSNADFFVINGDLTTYKQTIKERNLWIETLIQMGNQAPVILVAGNHGKELDGDLYVFVRAKASHGIYLCTEPEFIECARRCSRHLSVSPQGGTHRQWERAQPAGGFCRAVGGIQPAIRTSAWPSQNAKSCLAT